MKDESSNGKDACQGRAISAQQHYQTYALIKDAFY